MKLTSEQVQEISWEELEGYTLIEGSEWEQDSKSQSRFLIFEFEGKTYKVWQSRSGSPFTDWYYDECDVDAYEVERVEVVTKAWKAV